MGKFIGGLVIIVALGALGSGCASSSAPGGVIRSGTAPPEPDAGTTTSDDVDVDGDQATGSVDTDPRFDAVAARNRELVADAAQEAWDTHPCTLLFVELPARSTCGVLTVPADRDDPGGQQFRLEAVILHSTAGDPPEDPIVFLQGGPGAGAIEAVPLLQESFFDPLLESRDVVVLDQRGTGLSEPFIDCFGLLGRTFDPLSDSIPRVVVDGVAECRDELRTVVDLRDLSTLATAHDLEDLRRALGYRDLNLLGTSYGTRVALAYAREYPGSVRTIVLDGVDAPSVNAYVASPQTMANALDAIFDACAEDADCDAAYPDLTARFAALVEDLDDDPFELSAFEEMDGTNFVNLVHRLLYDPTIIPELPGLIAQFEQRNGAGLVGLVGAALDGDGPVSMSSAVQLVMACAEDVPFLAPTADGAGEPDETTAHHRLLAWALFAKWGPEICEVLGVDAAEGAGEAVDTDAPALVLTSGFDPITPPEFGRIAADTLPQSTVVNFPHATHVVLTHSRCAHDILAEFLDRPGSTPDIGCVAETEPPEFVLPAVDGSDETEAEAAEYVEFTHTDEFSAITEIRGLRPADWTVNDEFGAIRFMRQRSVLDLAEISLSSSEDFTDGLTLLEELEEAGESGFDPGFEVLASGPVQYASGTWDHVSLTVLDTRVDVYRITVGPDVIEVLIGGSVDEPEGFYADLAGTFLDSLTWTVEGA